MGLQEKMLRAYIRGCNDTWDLIEEAIKNVPGIGPKTQEKLMNAIKEKAAQEVHTTVNLRPAEQHKLHRMINQIGGGKHGNNQHKNLSRREGTNLKSN
ncbi:MAG: hypothetical protein GX664_04075 [Bacteroidales bacterium]|nr:hypothetical protein [Bacteroidales bacterium]